MTGVRILCGRSGGEKDKETRAEGFNHADPVARGSTMFFHLILTSQCNLQCRYCFGAAVEDVESDFTGFDVDYSLPKKIAYDVDLLRRFCSQDPECVLTFYGGEPLLCIEEIRQIMDRVKAKQFMIQTNGLLLDHLEPEYVNRFHTILVSIDGDEATTDFYRGAGTFKKVIRNLKLIMRNGFTGELIARMTVMEPTDVYRQVTWLLGNSEFAFSSVHWQLNAGFWGSDFAKRGFREWCTRSYNPGVRRLAAFWADQMEREGVVLRIYPFLGIADTFLSGCEASLLRCGSGRVNYAVQTDGSIVPCPAMWGLKDYYVGHIASANPLKLKQVRVGAPCTECDVYRVCGGRCLYANVTKRWSSEAYGLVCDSVRNLIDAVAEQMPRIRRLIEDGKISRKDFDFTKYNGCEIIP